MPNDKPDWTTATDIEAGTIDATITNASIEVSPVAGSTFDVAGSISADISNSSLTIDGGPITVENVSGDLLGTKQPQQLLINGAAVARDGTLHTLPAITLDEGAHAIAVYCSLNPTIIELIGGTTSADYALFPQTSSFSSAARYIFKVLPGMDAVLTPKFEFSSGSGNAFVWAVEILDTVLVVQDQDQAGLTMIGAPNSGGADKITPIFSELGKLSESRLAVSLENASPAPWEQANKLGTVNFVSVNAATQILAAAPSGQETYIHWFHLATGTANAQVQLVGMSSGHVYSAAQAANVGNPLWETDFHALALAAAGGTKGEALGLKSATGSAYFVTGHITAFQG